MTLHDLESSSMADYNDIDTEFDGCDLIPCKSTDDHNAYNYVFYIDGISVLMVSVFGIIGIIMSLIVLLKPQIREEKISKFLTALCLFDCSFLFLAILYIALPSISGPISCG